MCGWRRVKPRAQAPPKRSVEPQTAAWADVSAALTTKYTFLVSFSSNTTIASLCRISARIFGESSKFLFAYTPFLYSFFSFSARVCFWLATVWGCTGWARDRYFFSFLVYFTLILFYVESRSLVAGLSWHHFYGLPSFLLYSVRKWRFLSKKCLSFKQLSNFKQKVWNFIYWSFINFKVVPTLSFFF